MHSLHHPFSSSFFDSIALALSVLQERRMLYPTPDIFLLGTPGDGASVTTIQHIQPALVVPPNHSQNAVSLPLSGLYRCPLHTALQFLKNPPILSHGPHRRPNH